MRLHSLEVTAFGPFASTQRVDFDALTQAGLFLLHGPTGAGKSSLLDAVCFALYGQVPGARGTGRLRSDHAAEGVAPQVRCEFTVAGRRFEVIRSPEWERPKRRGTGTVCERAHVTLRERVGGAWVALTHRADEAGERLQELIGLGVDQFTKLVLLPQGDFAAFLHAHADERRTLLQKLFGTQRFMAVEDWLVNRRRELERQLDARAAITAQYLSRAEQALGDQIPPVGPADPADVRDADAVARLVQHWASWAHRRLGEIKQQAGTAESEFEQGRLAYDGLTEKAQLAATFTELTSQLQQLRGQEQIDRQRQGRLQAARSAVVLTPLLSYLNELDSARQLARERVLEVELDLSFEVLGALGDSRDDAAAGRAPQRHRPLSAEVVHIGAQSGAAAARGRPWRSRAGSTA